MQAFDRLQLPHL